MTAKPALLRSAPSRAMFSAPTGPFNPMLRGPVVTFAPDDGTVGGALSVDQAVAALAPSPVEETPEAAPVEAAEPEQIEAETSPAEEPVDEAETPADGEEAEAEIEAVAPAEPPKYWSKEAKERFAELPPELQAVVLEQEGPREAATAKAKAEAAEQAKTAQAEMGKVQQLADHLAEFLPQALETFQSRWGSNPDWVAYAHEHGVEAMTLAKTQHEAELGQLQKLNAAKAEAETQAQQAFVKAEFAKLSEIDPVLAHPETGAAKRTEVSQYLVKQGIEPQALQHISATEMSLAHKAMLWDQAQAAIKAKPTVKPVAAPAAKSPVRPAAAVAATPAQRTAVSVQNAFNSKPSVENAVALLASRK